MALSARAAAVALGPPLGAAGLALALATLTRDKAQADAMTSAMGPHGSSVVGGIVAFFRAACSSVEANRLLTALFAPLLLVFNALFGLEVRCASLCRALRRGP